MHGLTWPKLIELGALKMKDKCHISMIYMWFFLTNKIRWIIWKVERLYARLCYIRWIMLDLLNRPGFLALRPLYMRNWPPL